MLRLMITKRLCSSIKKDTNTCCQISNNFAKEFVKHGQATYDTHAHLFDFKKDSQLVLPMFSKIEFERRRETYVKYLSNYQSYYFKKKLNASEMNSNFIAIIPSGMTSFMAPDVPHTFKQNSDFLYLTGFKEPSSVLVMSRTSASSSFKSALFVRDKDPKKEVWEGAFTGPNEVNNLCGIEIGLPLSEFTSFLESLIKENGNAKTTLWKYPTLDIVKADAGPNCFNEEIEEALAMFCDENEDKLIVMNDLDESQEANANTSRTFVQLCRVSKSPQELEVMRQSCTIASEAFKQTMLASHPLVNEHLLYAKFDYECRIRGAEHLSYIPVIAGGPRATILHYIRNDQLIQNDRLVLMDAGCQYREYSSDLTRTWPVNGVFKGAQRDLYEACLDVQLHCLNECKPGMTLHNLYYEMIKKLGKNLIELGLLSAKDVNLERIDFESRKRIAKYCTHDIGHYLGIDVHDCPEVSKSMPFAQGTAITIEPGIYVRHDDESVPARYRGIGIRIEDDVAITQTGHEVLSAKCPKNIEDIENLLKVKCT